MNRLTCEEAVAGDLAAFDRLEHASDEEIVGSCIDAILWVSRSSVERAVKSSNLDHRAQERLKRWGYMCREGELWRVNSPPLPIEWDHDDEDLSRALMRLWELGEEPEGWMTELERRTLLARLRGATAP